MTILTIAVMVMIFCFSMQNADQSDATSGTISRQIVKIIHTDYETMDVSRQQSIFEGVQHAVRKCAHFLEYLLLGFSLRLCLESWIGHRRISPFRITLTACGSGMFYACTDELHQLAIDGRSGQFTDVLVDSAGAALGVLLGVFLIRLLSRGRKTIQAARKEQGVS